jgi:hypothetical protein
MFDSKIVTVFYKFLINYAFTNSVLLIDSFLIRYPIRVYLIELNQIVVVHRVE